MPPKQPPAADQPVPFWQNAQRPWTEPRAVLPAWAIAVRYTLMLVFLVLLLLQAFVPALAALVGSLLVDTTAAKRAPHLPLPRLSAPALFAAIVAIGGSMVSGVALRTVPPLVVAAVLAGALHLFRNRHAGTA